LSTIDVHELLRMKEDELASVRKEIEALRIAAPLLSEDHGAGLPPRKNSDGVGFSLEDFGVEEDSEQAVPSLESVDDDLGSIPPKRSRLRDWIGRAVGE
jgi:hypothetical protein